MQDQRLELLKPKMDKLFAIKKGLETRGKDFNTGIQNGHEYRNPRICEKLIETYKIRQYGTHFPPSYFDPEGWKKRKEAFYDSSMYKNFATHREEEKASVSKKLGSKK